MPCRDYTEDEYRSKERAEANKTKAMLCQVMTLVEAGKKVTKANWNAVECGYSWGHLQKWWEKHKRQDDAREREAEERRIDALKRNAIAKLTDEEIEHLLGERKKP